MTEKRLTKKQLVCPHCGSHRLKVFVTRMWSPVFVTTQEPPDGSMVILDVDDSDARPDNTSIRLEVSCPVCKRDLLDTEVRKDELLDTLLEKVPWYEVNDKGQVIRIPAEHKKILLKLLV